MDANFIMIWIKWCFFLITFYFLSYCYSGEDKNQSLKHHQSQVSKDLAHVVWNIMTVYEGEYNFEEVLVNLRGLNTGQVKPKPLNDCYTSLMETLEKKAEERRLLNLQAADSYLQKIRTINGVNEVIKNKLYYQVMHSGTGGIIKDLNTSPLILFREETINGEILSENVLGVRISPSEMILGLQKGMEGMKVGEKRKIFIHPDFAYGEFPKPEPYSFIIIEVTLISL